jgi:hypothetical protein
MEVKETREASAAPVSSEATETPAKPKRAPRAKKAAAAPVDVSADNDGEAVVAAKPATRRRRSPSAATGESAAKSEARDDAEELETNAG